MSAPSHRADSLDTRGDEGAGTPGASPAPGGLRAGLLTGRHSDPDWDYAEFEAFLRDDTGGLEAWFGADIAQAVATPGQRPGQPDEGTPSSRLQRARAMLRARVDRDIASIDAMLARQIDTILHHPRFQRLEGSWRGLGWLVSDIDPGGDILVRVLSATWSELARDMFRVLEFDQSNFFKLVYESEFGHAGGHPFGMMLIDREIAHLPPRRDIFEAAPVDDIEVLRQLASVAAAAFVPTVLAASPRLLGVESFAALSLAQDITAVQNDIEHRRWHDFAAGEDSRFLCLTLPRLLARPRWTRENNRLRHEEYAAGAEQQCWHCAGYAFARTVTRAQREYRWPGDIRGVTPGREAGSFVSGTTEDPLRFGLRTRIPRAPAELGFTDRQSQALVESGLMPLDTLPFGGVAFASTRSLQTRRAAPRHPNAADANQRLSAEIVSLLCVSRFAHHIKMLGRDMIGRLTTPEEIERELQEWLGRYTNTSTLSTGESRARFPLLSSRVQIAAREGQPGQYGCVIHLQPHYQLDDISTTFRLVTNLSSADRAGSSGGFASRQSGDS